jgi:GNAT superfamily N-acetyltransferase
VPSITIERLGRDVAASDVRALAELLVDAIDSGAGVSFLAGLTHDVAEAWWRSVLTSLPDRAVILVARDTEDGGIVGTVQLQPAWAPNQPHRADVAKLIVHRRARKRGIGQALMHALEQAARDAATFRRFQTFIRAMERTRDASAGSSKCRAASAQMSSGTGSGRSLSRVVASASASAARSASVK